jgi:hypothetical protein
MTEPTVPPLVPPAAPTAAVPSATPAVSDPPAGLAPVSPKRRNIPGIISFAFGVLAFLTPAITVLVVFAIFGRAPSVEGLDFFNIVIFGAIGLGIGFVPGLIAVVLAIVSFLIKDAKRWWGIIGLVLGIIAMCAGFVPLFAFIASGGNSGPTGVPLNG